MWSVTRENLDKNRKVNVNFTIDKHLYEQFKRVAQKDMRKYSNIVEGSILGMCRVRFKCLKKNVNYKPCLKNFSHILYF
jgi:hypothetical protein